MRSFLAISLPDPMLERLEILQSSIPTGRIMPPENLHLTLAFLGDPSEQDLEAVHTSMTALKAPRVPVEVSEVDCFDRAAPKILHAVVRPDPALMALQKKVLQVVRSAGLELPRKRFRPHVTLARFNGPLRGESAQRLANFLHHHNQIAPIRFEADSVALFRSDLGRGPAIHTELARYPLGPDQAGFMLAVT